MSVSSQDSFSLKRKGQTLNENTEGNLNRLF